MSRAARKQQAPQGGGATLWLQGLVCGVVLLVATPSALLAGVLLLPTLMVWMSDRQPGQPTARAVVLFGLAASCQPLDLLWRTGHRIEDAVVLITDLRTLAIAWSAQAGGWMLTQLLPLLIGFFVEAQASLVAQRLQKRLESLQEEWNSP
jgi:hypothetical protein